MGDGCAAALAYWRMGDADGSEDATSNTELLFLERAAPAEMVRGHSRRRWPHGVGVFANGDRWYWSGVLTGATVANTGEFDEQKGYLARAAFLPLRGESMAFTSAPTSRASSSRGHGCLAADQQRVRLRERPELRNDTTRFVDTGNISAEELVAYGLEAGGYWNNLYLAAEVFQIDVDRRAQAPIPSSTAGMCRARGLLTGEHRRWNGANGGFQGIRPTNAFDPRGGHWGAWEIAARYTSLDLNDNEGALGSAASAATQCAAASRRSPRSGSIGIPTTRSASC